VPGCEHCDGATETCVSTCRGDQVCCKGQCKDTCPEGAQFDPETCFCVVFACVCTPPDKCCKTAGGDQACTRVSSDPNNCGDCGKVCPAGSANGCVDGECRCGSSPVCPAGLRCVDNACRCDGTSCPDGCCQSSTCQVGNAQACGRGGGDCRACGAGQSCTNGVCGGITSGC
jgi:hypothetical protein